MASQKGPVQGNEPAVQLIGESLRSGEAIAFVGAGASAGLFPLWGQLLERLSEEVLHQGGASLADVKRWKTNGATPQSIAQTLKNSLGPELFGEIIHEVFKSPGQARARPFTDIHASLMRLPFRGYITTNYDHGLLNARHSVLPEVTTTSYGTWRDEDILRRWHTRDIFKDQDRPILFAHGSHDRSDTIILTADDYHLAYDQGHYRRFFDNLWSTGRLVFVGFGFSDPWLEFLVGGVLREVMHGRAGRSRHVALMGLHKGQAPHSEDRKRYRREFGCEIYFYRIHKDATGREDHGELLEFLQAMKPCSKTEPGATGSNPLADEPIRENIDQLREERLDIPSRWTHETTDDDRYAGRFDDLNRLNTWARDRTVKVVAVTGFGGLGKTSLVGHWLKAGEGCRSRGVEGLFFWSFYADREPKSMFAALKAFAKEELGVPPRVGTTGIVKEALAILRDRPFMLVLDGLEVLQERPDGDSYGSLLEIELRDFLTGACRDKSGSLIVLTSRFPFQDLSRHLGAGHRALALEKLSPEDGALLLSNCGVEGGDQARALVSERFEGHPLALRIFASALSSQADRDPTRLVKLILGESRLDGGDPLVGKIHRLLKFYEEHLPPARRAMLRTMSLFRSPVDLATLKRLVSGLKATRAEIGSACESILKALLAELRSDHLILRDRAADGREIYSCHPILRDHFRQSMISLEEKAPTKVADLLSGRPDNDQPSCIAEIEPILSAVELLQQAGNFVRADDLYKGRLQEGRIFRVIPAPHEGLNCVLGFVADEARRRKCTDDLGGSRLSYYMNAAGLNAAFAGELTMAMSFFDYANSLKMSSHQRQEWMSGLMNQTWTMLQLGKIMDAVAATKEIVEQSAIDSNQDARIRSLVHHAFALSFAGDASGADAYFLDADRMQRSIDPKRRGLQSLAAVWWADLLIRAGAFEKAEAKISAALPLCLENGWMDEVARFELLLGRIASAQSNVEEAELRLGMAESIMRSGHMLTELPGTLTSLAEVSIARKDWDLADERLEEAKDLSRLRSMRPALAETLAARSRLRLEQGRVRSSQSTLLLYEAEDNAGSARELARQCSFAWARRDACNLLVEILNIKGDESQALRYREEAEDLAIDLRLRPAASARRPRRV